MTDIFSGILIASDIDGTFMDNSTKPIQLNYDAVNYFKKHGGLFTFATGRYGSGINDIVPQFDKLVNAPVIMCNGAYIYDFKTESKIFKQTLDGVSIYKILKEVSEIFPKLDQIRFTCERGDYDINNIKDDLLPEDEWYKVVIIGDPTMLDEVRSYVKSKSGDYLSFSKSCAILLEFLHHDATKGVMLRYLKNYLGGNLTSYAIGDYENDYDMLIKCDVSVCPSNALDSIKAISKIQVCSNTEGALADLIYKIEKRK